MLLACREVVDDIDVLAKDGKVLCIKELDPAVWLESTASNASEQAPDAKPLLNRYGNSHALPSSFVSSLGVVLCAAGGPVGGRDTGAVS